MSVELGKNFKTLITKSCGLCQNYIRSDPAFAAFDMPFQDSAKRVDMLAARMSDNEGSSEGEESSPKRKKPPRVHLIIMVFPFCS